VINATDPALVSLHIKGGINVPTRKPKLYETLAKRYPSYIEAVEALGKAVNEVGPLDEKTLHLIQLAAAAAQRAEGAVHSHTRRALKAGATQQEIEHALIALTSTIGFPQVTAALSWANDVVGDSKSK
jgi:4-carboxymuconolactone decarboxylase